MTRKVERVRRKGGDRCPIISGKHTAGGEGGTGPELAEVSWITAAWEFLPGGFSSAVQQEQQENVENVGTVER